MKKEWRTVVAGVLVCISSMAAEPLMVTHHYRGIRPDDLQGRQGLANPERGLRTEMYAGELPDEQDLTGLVTLEHKDKQFRNFNWQAQLDSLQFDGVRIVQCYVYLTHYCGKPIPQKKLDDFDKLMNEFRRYGAKALLRFAYEKNMERKVGPDGETVLQHLKTLTPLIRKNSDVIFVLQAGFIGAWGEWHSSCKGLERDHSFTAKLLHGILEALPPNRATMVRVPRYKREAMGNLPFRGFVPLTEKNAFTDTPAARIGYHNDGFLANRDCGGTFPQPPYSNPGNFDFDQMTSESLYLPIDGELFWGAAGVSKPVDGVRAIVRMRDHHYTTFSMVHSSGRFERVPFSIDNWRHLMLDPKKLAENGISLSDGYFEDARGTPVLRSAYEFIRDHLGYRFELRRASFPEKMKKDQDLKFNCSIFNRGFGILVNPRPVYLTLQKKDGERYDFRVPADLRRWYPKARNGKDVAYTLSLTRKLPADLTAGEYRVGLWFPDEAPTLRDRGDFAIRLANGDTVFAIDSERNGGVNFIGKCVIEK